MTFATVSPQDFEAVNKIVWTLHTVQLKDSLKYYAEGSVNGTTVRMHKFILGDPPESNMVIDHRNGENICRSQNPYKRMTRF